MIGVVTGLGGGAGAIDGGSISPLTLSASGQEFTITYTGKTVDPATPNLIVAQCIADDTKVGFDTEIDCSPLSLVNYISGEIPKLWTDEVVRVADVVITMGCGDACPFYPGTRYEDWPLDDPAGQGLEAVRPVRDAIETRVRTLLGSLGVPVDGAVQRAGDDSYL